MSLAFGIGGMAEARRRRSSWALLGISSEILGETSPGASVASEQMGAGIVIRHNHGWEGAEWSPKPNQML